MMIVQQQYDSHIPSTVSKHRWTKCSATVRQPYSIDSV